MLVINWEPLKDHPHCSSSSFTVSDGHLKRRSEAIVELVNYCILA